MANLKTSTHTLYRWIKKKPLIRLIENSYIKYGKTWLFKAFISFIKKIYQNTESIISNNGFLSDLFSLSRRVRQGCPLSLFLYIVNGEVINLNSKSNKKIGISHTKAKRTIKTVPICRRYQLFCSNRGINNANTKLSNWRYN